MIEKIERIKSIGRYRDFQAKNDIAFRRLTLLFAENARGKTTLAAILRSAKTGEPSHLLERASIGSSTPAEIELRINGAPYRYAAGKWASTLPHIEIFDEAYIEENVCSGREVDHDHRRSLYSFVIGAEGVTIKKQIDDLDIAAKAAGRDIAAKETALRGYISSDYTPGQFAALVVSPDVQARFKEAEAKLAAVQQQDRVQRETPLETLKPPMVNLENLQFILASGPDVMDSAVVNLAQSHLRHSTQPTFGDWVEEGLEYIDQGKCPFCLRPLIGVAHLAAWRSYFSDAYRQHKETLASKMTDILDEVGEKRLADIELILARNQAKDGFWSNLTGKTAGSIQIDKLMTACTLWREQIKLLHDEKTLHPLDPIKLIPAVEAMGRQVEKECETVQAYNGRVLDANTAIEELKTAVSKSDQSSAGLALQRLKDEVGKAVPTVQALCVAYLDAKRKKDELDAAKEAARKALEQHTANLLKQYQTSINAYLSQFGAAFTIVETDETFIGGKPSLKYKIGLDNATVPLEGKPGSNTPTFKNTLSSGDRGTLALAFFLAKIDSDPEIASKIIVFDDPVTSLDDNRRSHTRHRILWLTQRSAQVIVLSHDSSFLKLIWRTPGKRDQKALAVEFQGSTSGIVEWDLERATQDRYFALFQGAEDFLSGVNTSDPPGVAASLRWLVEGNLRRKHPNEFRTMPNLGSMIAKIRQEAGRFKKVDIDGVVAINDYSSPFHHDEGGDPPERATVTNIEELKAHIKKTMELLA